MNNRWYWSMGTQFEPFVKGYYRHSLGSDASALDVPNSWQDRVETGKPWRARRLTMYSSRKRRLEDMPFCWLPVWSERAVEILSPLLARDGEFVPVNVKWRGTPLAAQYFLYQCLRIYPAADRSVMVPSDFDEQGRVEILKDLRLSYEHVPQGVNAFRCREAAYKLLVSEDVAAVLDGSDLSGWALGDPQDPPWRRRSLSCRTWPTGR